MDELVKAISATKNLESETEPDGENSSKKSTPKYKRRRKRDKDFKPNYDIAGVYKLTLSLQAQVGINCVVGQHVTSEKPWTSAEKDLFVEDLESNLEDSEFLPIKTEILDATAKEFLIGYIPDESKDIEDFFICISEDAIREVKDINDKVKILQESRLKNAVLKKIRRWKGLGSEKEVDETKLKTNRNLIEVEIESKYPILPFKIHFKTTKVEDLRDGYMELRPGDDPATILRKRVDISTQVTPSVRSNEAQTICRFPRNSYTQYSYELPLIEDPRVVKDADAFLNQNLEDISDILQVNDCLNLYADDYKNLVLNPAHSERAEKLRFREYICFIKMEICKKKMISSVTWHPMWSGCFVSSYIDIAPPMYIHAKPKKDVVYSAIYDSNPVLFWSFNDDLTPKLLLETPRSIYSLSCCPFNENIVIGGCLNGQVILWDISNKLTKVEETEILTTGQQKYRAYMFSLMDWMKNIFDLTKVRPTAFSDLRHSHTGTVRRIAWLSPFQTITKTGKITEDPSGQSLQMATTGDEGTILFWDLLDKPKVTKSEFKGMKRVHRLKKRPSALSTMESPFKVLHLRWRPIFKLKIMDSTRLVNLFTSSFHFHEFKYETDEGKVAEEPLDTRVIFNPVLRFEDSLPTRRFFLGTMEGDFIHATWEGSDFDSGEAVNFEEAKVLNFGKYHDGPVVSVEYSSACNIILTVGGKIWAYWSEELLHRPIAWRKGKSVYTSGHFFNLEQASIKLTRIDGYVEIWRLFQKSRTFIQEALMSNTAVTEMTTHRRKIKENVFGLCDNDGCLRLFLLSHIDPGKVQERVETMTVFLSNEIARKKDFFRWQDEFNKEKVKKVEKIVKEETGFKLSQEVSKKLKSAKEKPSSVSAGLRYLDSVQEEQKIHEQERIKRIILSKKQLNTEEMLKKKEPLRKLEEETEAKKKKQKQKIKESEKMFQVTVAMLFPDVVKEKPVPPPDPYTDCNEESLKEENYLRYQRLEAGVLDYVSEHPYTKEFNWKNVLITGRERRERNNDLKGKTTHWKRFESSRGERSKTSIKTVEGSIEGEESIE